MTALTHTSQWTRKRREDRRPQPAFHGLLGVMGPAEEVVELSPPKADPMNERSTVRYTYVLTAPWRTSLEGSWEDLSVMTLRAPHVPLMNMTHYIGTPSATEMAARTDRFFAAYTHVDPPSDELLIQFLTSAIEAPAAIMGAADRWQTAIAELQSLGDGWNGNGSIAPTDRAVADLQAVSAYLRPANLPEFTVDDSDGEVSLTWTKAGSPAFASLVFSGNGRVTIVGRDDDREQVMSIDADISDRATVINALRTKPLSKLVFEG